MEQFYYINYEVYPEADLMEIHIGFTTRDLLTKKIKIAKYDTISYYIEYDNDCACEDECTCEGIYTKKFEKNLNNFKVLIANDNALSNAFIGLLIA